MSRVARWMSVAVLLTGAFAFAPVTPPAVAYHVVASLSSVMDGHPLARLVLDRDSNRLFAGAPAGGVYTADLNSKTPRMTGPIVKAHATVVEVAPDLHRVFYSGVDGIGWVSEQGGPAVPMTDKNTWASDLVYEPTHHEIYAAFNLEPYVLVFDAESGARRGVIDLPGSNALQLEAVPGTVFLLLGDKQGLFAIDANTHQVTPWEVDGSLVTPGLLQADPSGRYLFMARAREIDQIDIATHRIVGKATMFGTPGMSFDPANGMLVAAFPEAIVRDDQLVVFQPGADGLKQVGVLKNTSGGTHLIRTNHGFIQSGDHAFLVWSTQ